MVRFKSAAESKAESEGKTVTLKEFQSIMAKKGNKGVKERREIISVYRYFDEGREKEFFYYHEQRSADTNTDGWISAYTSHVGFSEEFPPSEEFEWTPANLANIKKYFTTGTNFYAYIGDRRTAINRHDFETARLADIENRIATVRIDAQSLISAVNNVATAAAATTTTTAKKSTTTTSPAT
ncbi:hypothetical protein Ngar_c13580 [Candidatus Nitrososphaera gargensis Ga9.2]|uniref:Uncharacterized protein n=1 Tax=Nitrososphaera gargensis (strain Ga9.2) TaxID=1237085 RepID=K0IAF6_NITGG|nr:hypothetical protein [Candidatus Nitrososphaera gargensis]AFU58296.1 hypothetical protein Ngar_c13580 [Candidatus Nitrososphaera gargensis Ga9.2]